MEKQYRLIEGAILSTLVRFALAVFLHYFCKVLLCGGVDLLPVCVSDATLFQIGLGTPASHLVQILVCEAVPLFGARGTETAAGMTVGATICGADEVKARWSGRQGRLRACARHTAVYAPVRGCALNSGRRNHRLLCSAPDKDCPGAHGGDSSCAAAQSRKIGFPVVQNPSWTADWCWICRCGPGS